MLDRVGRSTHESSASRVFYKTKKDKTPVNWSWWLCKLIKDFDFANIKDTFQVMLKLFSPV